MVSIQLSDFDLAQICDSGQCFRMYRIEDNATRITGMPEEFEIVSGDMYLRAGQNQVDTLSTDLVEKKCDGTTKECASTLKLAQPRQIIFDCSEEEYESFWKHYFDIDGTTDYKEIKQMVPQSDVFLTNAIQTGSGIRILNQDLWEMIVSFLISQQNNIPRIHKCIENISRRYGEKRHCQTQNYYTFPTPEALANLEEDALMECNLGYRSKYVVRTAREIVEGKFDLDEIAAMSYLDARAKLLEMYGVGVKVADCICLFALHHLESFPIDTHIKQVLEREYGMDTRKLSLESFSSNNSAASANPLARYSGVQGVIQQYIFYAELQDSRRNN